MTTKDEAEGNEPVEDTCPPSLHLPNAEWREADRLGRILLDNFDAQLARRRELNIFEDSYQGEDNDE